VALLEATSPMGYEQAYLGKKDWFPRCKSHHLEKKEKPRKYRKAAERMLYYFF
jgi:hypothetical protein